MRTLDGMTYETLFSVLQAHGFQEVPNAKARVFVQNETEAEIILPFVRDEEPLRAHHYVMAQVMMSDYAIMTRDAFDLALLQAAHRLPIAA